MAGSVTANGKSYEIQPGMPLARFLAELHLDPAWVVMELNDEPVPRVSVDGIRLQGGDRLEIVRAVPGG